MGIVYAPKGDNNAFDNGWWELMWPSKEAADKAWSSENPEFIEWAEKYESVISCDGEGRYPWTFIYQDRQIHLEKLRVKMVILHQIPCLYF